MITGTDIAKILTKAVVDNGRSEEVARHIIDLYPKKAPAIIKALKRMRNLDESFVVVKTARELSLAEKAEIEECFNKKFNSKTKDPLFYRYDIEPDLGAGIIIKKGEIVIDNSLKHKINQVIDKINYTNVSQE